MTTLTIGNTVQRLTIEEKASLLYVFSINEPGTLAVQSGSNPKNAYVVQHDSRHATYCPCKAHTPRCAHAIAVEMKLKNDRRTAYNYFELSLGN